MIQIHLLCSPIHETNFFVTVTHSEVITAEQFTTAVSVVATETPKFQQRPTLSGVNSCPVSGSG